MYEGAKLITSGRPQGLGSGLCDIAQVILFSCPFEVGLWLCRVCVQLFRHYKSPPFHSVIRIHPISLLYHILVILSSHFSSMEQMLMLYSQHCGAIKKLLTYDADISIKHVWASRAGPTAVTATAAAGEQAVRAVRPSLHYGPSACVEQSASWTETVHSLLSVSWPAGGVFNLVSWFTGKTACWQRIADCSSTTRSSTNTCCLRCFKTYFYTRFTQ